VEDHDRRRARRGRDRPHLVVAAMSPCERCHSPLELGDLRCAVCALPIELAVADAGKPHAQVLRCRECGAAVAFSPHVQAPHWGFGRSRRAIEQPVDPLEEADRMLPFAVDRDSAERALRGWLAKRGYFAPAALASEAVFDSLVPL